MGTAMTKPMMRPWMKIACIYFLARWATDVSPPQLGIRKAACGKNWLLRGRQGPYILSHQFTITTRSFVKTEMREYQFRRHLKRTPQDIQPNCLTPNLLNRFEFRPGNQRSGAC